MMLFARMREVWDGLISFMRRDSIMHFARAGVSKGAVGVPT